jgi:hypothetical protein
VSGPIADQQVNAHLAGVDPVTGNVLTYQTVPVMARTIYSNYDGRQPFYTNYGKGFVPNTAATYDAVTGASLNTATRHIDPYGSVAELHKVWMLLWYWLMDGAPTNMGPLGGPTNRIPTYITLANQLRPWPIGFTGAASGEPTQGYPAFPPIAPTKLDSFMSQTVTTDAARAKAAFHEVEPVRHSDLKATLHRAKMPYFPPDPVGQFPPPTPVGPEHVATKAVSPNIPVAEILHKILQRLDALEAKLA